MDVGKRAVTFASTRGPMRRAYDVLVGADGMASQVRLALVRADRSVRSQVSWMAPMRYVSATNLRADVEWPKEASKRMVAAPTGDVTPQSDASTSGAPFLAPCLVCRRAPAGLHSRGVEPATHSARSASMHALHG